jgi:hypothetical protein
MGAKNKLEGRQFGRLTVLEEAGKTEFGAIRWLCRCSCGVEKVISGYCLIQGKALSCGCYKNERAKELRTIHGHAYDDSLKSEYATWKSIRQRCYNPNTVGSEFYLGKGIKVCERWMKSFKNFLDDMGPKPDASYSIDRIDNNGNYEPSNCRWATRQEQVENRSVCIKYEYNGESLLVSQWAKKLNAPRNGIYKSMKRGKKFSEIVEFYLKKKNNAVVSN